MPIFHIRQLQLEVRRRPFAGMMIPTVGEQDTPISRNKQVIAAAFFIVLSSADGIIVATGFVRIPREPPPRSAEVSLAPCSLSLDV